MNKILTTTKIANRPHQTLGTPTYEHKLSPLLLKPLPHEQNSDLYKNC